MTESPRREDRRTVLRSRYKALFFKIKGDDFFTAGGLSMENSMLDCTLPQFGAALASKEAVPGGGGASALTGALASALASMVCGLTFGKRKYARYEEDLKRIADRASELRLELLCLIDEDAAAFEPLSRAYAVPKDAPERAEVMERALKTACRPPMDIAERCKEVLGLLLELSAKGSAIAVSDVGAGAQLARAAALAAGLNVRINAKSMADRQYAETLLSRLDGIESACARLAESAYGKVLERIG